MRIGSTNSTDFLGVGIALLSVVIAFLEARRKAKAAERFSAN